jgi:hypothetical protein
MALVNKAGVAARPSTDVVDIADRNRSAGAPGRPSYAHIGDAQKRKAGAFARQETPHATPAR